MTLSEAIAFVTRKEIECYGATEIVRAVPSVEIDDAWDIFTVHSTDGCYWTVWLEAGEICGEC